jgi:hypothetical protein
MRIGLPVSRSGSLVITTRSSFAHFAHTYKGVALLFLKGGLECSKKMWMGDIVCSLPPTHCLRRYFPFFSQMLSGMRPARSGRVTRVEALQGGARRVRFTSSLYPTTQSSLRTCAMEEQAMQVLTRITSTSTSTRTSRTTLDRTGTTPGKGITVTRQEEMLAGRWHSMAK